MTDTTVTTTRRMHCAWASCSRLYTPDRPGHTYCGHVDCPATTQSPEHGPRPTTQTEPVAESAPETFAERRARVRAAFEAEWQANHGPKTLTNDDPINPHKHTADTAPGTRCMVRPDGTCMIPHDCRCPILWACSGGCYRTEVAASYHPNRPTVTPTPVRCGFRPCDGVGCDDDDPYSGHSPIALARLAATYPTNDDDDDPTPTDPTPPTTPDPTPSPTSKRFSVRTDGATITATYATRGGAARAASRLIRSDGGPAVVCIYDRDELDVTVRRELAPLVTVEFVPESVEVAPLDPPAVYAARARAELARLRAVVRTVKAYRAEERRCYARMAQLVAAREFEAGNFELQVATEAARDVVELLPIIERHRREVARLRYWATVTAA